MKYDLSLSDLFIGINPDDLEKILNEYASFKSYKKGEYIFVKGEKPEYMYILLDGALTVFSDDINGKRELLSSFKEPGVLFAEVYLYLKKEIYHFSAVADEYTETLALSREFFSKVLDTGENGRIILKNYLNILSEKLFYFNEKIRMMSGFTLRQKLARYIITNSENKSEFKLKHTREELADYLGATRPSISRELNKMQEEGLIELNRSKIKIKDMDSLNLYY